MKRVLPIVCLTCLAGAPTAAASPTGYWKLSLSIDFTSSGRATNDHCFPDPEQPKPSTLTASASETVTVRTVRPTLVDAHQAANGVPVFGEYPTARPFRAKATSTRRSGLDGSGRPFGCVKGSPKPACGSRSIRSGLYVNPLGGVNSWRGFVVELQQTPLEAFQDCPMTAAQEELGEPFTIEVKAPPRKLTGNPGKLKFKGREKLAKYAQDENTESTATGSVRWTVTLRPARP